MSAFAKAAVAFAVCLLLGGGAWLGVKKLTAKPGPTYETGKVERGRIAPRVTATGTLSALVTVQVGAQVSGRVQELKADFNSTVKKGDTIARIDPQLFDAALENAKANYVSAQGSLVKAQVAAADAERQYKRNSELLERRLVAPADVDTLKANSDAAAANIDVMKGNLAQAKAQWHQAEVNLAYTTIVSPINGTVISRNVDVGQTVAASLSAPTLFVIAEDLRRMQVDTSVAEADVGKLAPGMPATFSVDAFPNEKFRGTVRQVRNAATTIQNVVTYDAVIDVENPELKLKPGMTANVTFVWAERDDVLKVPNAALRFKPSADALAKNNVAVAGFAGTGTDGADHPHGNGGKWRKHNAEAQAPVADPSDAGAQTGDRPEAGWKKPADEKTVWMLKDGQLEAVKVKVGVTDGTNTEVVSGLSENDEVVTESNDPAGGQKPKQQGAPGMGGPGGMRMRF
jgi:HlyD family secretion protein